MPLSKLTTVPAPSIAALRARVHGTVRTADDPDFAEEHAVWNRAKQRTPIAIVRCTHTSDVVAAVEFARTADLPIAVRGGGQSPAGMSSCEGLVIDLRSMHAVGVDPLGRVAVVGGGATWSSVDVATQRFGYAVPGIPLSRVGVAGSTLGGGFGHLRRAYGLACDNLIGADLVLADGTLVATSGDLHPELLWGLRGGGGNFGVVTSMRFRMQPLPAPVLSGPVVFAAEHAERLLRFYREYTATMREDVSTRLALFGAGASATRSFGRGRRGAATVITAACVGHPDASEPLIRPIRSAAPVLVDRLRPQPYAELQADPDPNYPPGRFAAVTSCYVDELDDELITALCAAAELMPDSGCEIHVHHMGGAVGRVARMSTAVANRAARYLITLVCVWDRPDQQPDSEEWLASAHKAVQPSAVGGPHVGLHSEPVSSVEAYGAERYLRLAALKRRFDPDNVFAANLNVVPLA
jgi:FAD/FMN-containing dehydrogenase